jgi:hypothetical protein
MSKSIFACIAVALLTVACSQGNPVQPTRGAEGGTEAAIKLPDADQGGRPFVVTLTGAAEVPGPGDPDGTGTTTLSVNLGQQQVCWQTEWANIAAPTAAHIHRGAVDVAGPVVVPLLPVAGGCTSNVSRDVLRAILTNPENYYVNVHNPPFPAGAIRGQLR